MRVPRFAGCVDREQCGVQMFNPMPWPRNVGGEVVCEHRGNSLASGVRLNVAAVPHTLPVDERAVPHTRPANAHFWAINPGETAFGTTVALGTSNLTPNHKEPNDVCHHLHR